jgi:hypothetical protein
VSAVTRVRLRVGFLWAVVSAAACSYPDYGFSNSSKGGGGAAGSAGVAGSGESGGSGGTEPIDAGDASDAKQDGPDAASTCKPSTDLELGKAVAGTNDPLSGANISNAIKDYTCATKACDGFEATWSFTPTDVATYRFTLTGLTADCDLYIVGPALCGGTCATPASSSTTKVGSTETVDVPLLAATEYFVSVDASAGILCNFQLLVVQL